MKYKNTFPKNSKSEIRNYIIPSAAFNTSPIPSTFVPPAVAKNGCPPPPPFTCFANSFTMFPACIFLSFTNTLLRCIEKDIEKITSEMEIIYTEENSKKLSQIMDVYGSLLEYKNHFKI